MSGNSGEPFDLERILEQVRADDCQFVELHFTDVAGAVKSVMVPTVSLAETLRDGHWFDGSALEGGARLIETDLLLRPDLRTWGVIPWQGAHGERTGRLLCDIQTPEGTPFPADPRAVLRRITADAADLGLSCHVASEVEFFLFHPAAGVAGVGHPLDRGGYFDLVAQPDNRVRDEMLRALAALGVPVEAGHHEIGPGQHEIDLPLLPALAAADALVTCKFVVRAIARRQGLVATFMPKPLAEVAGSGLHLQQVLLDGAGEDALADPADRHGLSATGRAFIAGQLAHARAMCAVLAPTVNSYKRIGRGFDAPVRLTWDHTDPTAVVRVPRTRRRSPALAHARSAPQERVLWLELRCPDPSCNPYLALAVALAAGLDGIRARLSPPGGPDATGTGGDADVGMLPGSLGEALGELEWDAVVRDALGAPVYERLLLVKEQEWQAYRRQVSSWELARYFESS